MLEDSDTFSHPFEVSYHVIIGFKLPGNGQFDQMVNGFILFKHNIIYAYDYQYNNCNFTEL